MNILLTSVGRRTYLIEYFKSALLGKGLVFACNNISTFALTQADGYVISPDIYSDDYIPFILRYCIQNRITAIIPLYDVDLPVLAKVKSFFLEKGIVIIVSNERIVSTCNDKWLSYGFLSGYQINCPTSYLSVNDTLKALDNYEIVFPLVIKPRWGMGSVGVWIANDRDELKVLYNKARRDVFNTAIKYESSKDIDKCIIIQQLICGREYGIEIVNDMRGQYVTTMPKVKYAMRAGETDVAKTIADKRLIELGERISKALMHVGLLDIDCIMTESGDIYVLDMNNRIGGQYPFSHIAGANFPLQIIRWLEGGSTDIGLLSPKVGVSASKDIAIKEVDELSFSSGKLI